MCTMYVTHKVCRPQTFLFFLKCILCRSTLYFKFLMTRVRRVTGEESSLHTASTPGRRWTVILGYQTPWQACTYGLRGCGGLSPPILPPFPARELGPVLPAGGRRFFVISGSWVSRGWKTPVIVIMMVKVRLVKAMVFPGVMHGCESWTIKKAEC